MKRLFLLLVMGLTLTVPCAFADDDEFAFIMID